MTATDPFTEARAYAEQACYQDENIPIAEAGFRAGWKAARTHLAAEVRKAKAEALREAADWWAANPDDDAFETDGDTRNWLRDVATEYEAGGSDEHR